MSMIRRDVLRLVMATLLIATYFSSAIHAADYNELSRLIALNEDPMMTQYDLAFFLATHSFDAAPKDEYVEVRLIEGIYRLAPNGRQPGLADFL